MVLDDNPRKIDPKAKLGGTLPQHEILREVCAEAVPRNPVKNVTARDDRRTNCEAHALHHFRDESAREPGVILPA